MKPGERRPDFVAEPGRVISSSARLASPYGRGVLSAFFQKSFFGAVRILELGAAGPEPEHERTNMPRRKKPEPKPASLWELPQLLAVYALCGGSERRRYVAYVGIARKLRRRIGQHLITRDSGVAVGTSAVGINAADYVTEVCWWQSGSFRGKYALEAAEMVATEILQPAIKARCVRPSRHFDERRGREEIHLYWQCLDDGSAQRVVFRQKLNHPEYIGLNSYFYKWFAVLLGVPEAGEGMPFVDFEGVNAKISLRASGRGPAAYTVVPSPQPTDPPTHTQLTTSLTRVDGTGVAD